MLSFVLVRSNEGASTQNERYFGRTSKLLMSAYLSIGTSLNMLSAQASNIGSQITVAKIAFIRIVEPGDSSSSLAIEIAVIICVLFSLLRRRAKDSKLRDLTIKKASLEAGGLGVSQKAPGKNAPTTLSPSVTVIKSGHFYKFL